jgi:hypothetical protein
MGRDDKRGGMDVHRQLVGADMTFHSCEATLVFQV